jgi:hypothetical protein
MGGITALLGYLGGRGQAREHRREEDAASADRQAQLAAQERYQTAMQDYQNRELDERRRVDDATIAQNAATAGIDPVTGQVRRVAIPPSLQQIVPHNRGKTLDPITTATARVNHFTDLATTARQQGALQDADFYAAAARDAALNLGTLESAAYKAGPQTDLARANINFLDARTVTEQQRPALLKAQTLALRDLPARARQIAAGHDAASLQRAMMEIQNRTELAHFNANVRVGIAHLAAAYRVSGQDVSNAIRLGIADMTNSTKLYLAQTDPHRLILGGGDPSAPAPSGGIDIGQVVSLVNAIRGQQTGAPGAPGAPGTTFNVTLGSDGTLRTVPAAGAGGAGGGASSTASRTSSTAVLSPRALKRLDEARTALKRGVSLEDVMSALTAGASRAGLTPGDVAAIRAALQPRRNPLPPVPLNRTPISGLQLKPLPLQGATPFSFGGSQNNVPFQSGN